jgi:hypothetical protein
MWRSVSLIRSGVSEERVASIFMAEKIRQRKKALAVGETVWEDMFLRNVVFHKTHTGPYPRRRQSS